MNFDIVIVGGGPAGLSASKKAAEFGCRVALFEKSNEIGYPIHTSGGSWIDELEKLGIPQRFMHPIKYGEFITNKSRVAFKYDTSPSCILDVRSLYQYLAEQASLSGVEIFVNAKVVSPIVCNDFVKGVSVNINGKIYDVHSKLVIDASGFNAIIARKMGLLDKFKIYGAGAEYELIAPKWDQDKVCFLLGDKIPAGYGWIFPRGHCHVRVGVAIIHPFSKISPIKYLDTLLSSDNEITEQLKPYSRIEFHTGFIPNDGILPKAIKNGLIVVGDAAGQVLAIVGEGIRFALDIGNIAGLVASEAISKKKYDENFLVNYERRWRKKYELKFNIGYGINKRLRSYTPDQWDKKSGTLLQLGPDLLVDFLKGDFSVKFFFKSLRQQPKLLNHTLFKIIRQMIGLHIGKKKLK